jgi:enoyl-CoA hydratase/carnithine racemase
MAGVSAVHLELVRHLAELRLDNPGKLNCLTVTMLGQMAQHLEVIAGRPEVRAVLVTAAGERAFCTGADIGAWGGLSPAAFARDWVAGGHRLFDRLARLGKPTIAVISGHAFGGGLELAAACDVRVMHPKATLALPEAGVGIVPGWSGTQRLTRLMPEGVLKDMALFGTRLTAAQALACGFVAEVADDPRAAAMARAERAAGLSPRAVEIAKAMVHAGVGEDAGAMVEMLGSAAIAATADRDEGVAAFREKRAAVFPGV